MNTVAFGELSAAHVPLRRELPFAYALAVLSRQSNGAVYVWTGCSTPADLEQPFKWMSVTKALVAVTFWIQSLPQMGNRILPLEALVPPPAPPGVTLRDLLAHCSGLPFDNPQREAKHPEERMGVHFGIAPPQARVISPFTKRVYSNYSFEVAVRFAEEKLSENWIDWVRRTLLRPLGMTSTNLATSPAWGATGSITDLARLAAELLSPVRTPLSPTDIARFTLPVHPGLRGMLPGYGHHRDNLWGTGVELHGHKTPHYLPESFPPEVFGHFGQSGSFIWIDQGAGVAGVFLGAEDFGSIHKALWPELNTQMRQLALSARS